MTTPDTPARPLQDLAAWLRLVAGTPAYFVHTIESANTLRCWAEEVEACELAGAVEPPVPVHWRAMLDPEQVPQQLKTSLHVVGFRGKREADSWIAEQLDFHGWRYTLEPLYAATPVATGWLPIESAPKDGTWIVGAEWQQAEGYDPELSTESVRFSSGMWCYESGAACRPTYWMPRPPGAASSTPAPEPLGWHLLTKGGRVVRWHDSLHTFDPREGGFSGMPARADEMDPDHAPHHWSLVFAAPTQRDQAIPSPLSDQKLQELFSATIDGALATGFQGGKAPPEGHWLTRFYDSGRELAKDREAAIREGMLKAAVICDTYEKHLASEARPSFATARALAAAIRAAATEGTKP